MRTTSLITYLILSFFSSSFFLTAQTNVHAQNSTNKLYPISFNSFSKFAKVDSGIWSAETKGDIICITLMDKKVNQDYVITNCFLKDEFARVDSATGSYGINRLAGDLVFSGNELPNKGTGSFTFSRNATFESFLENEGVETSDELYYFKLFLGDITKEYISGIKELGHDPTIRELGRLAWHDAGLKYIETISKAGVQGLDLDMISVYAAHDISFDFIQSLKDMGFDQLEAKSIKKAKTHNVSANFIQNMREGGNHFETLDEYIRLKKTSRQRHKN